MLFFYLNNKDKILIIVDLLTNKDINIFEFKYRLKLILYYLEESCLNYILVEYLKIKLIFYSQKVYSIANIFLKLTFFSN